MIRINKEGQSLVEALIALGVAAIVVSAMAVAAITSVNDADFSKYQNLATNYAQQGMEIIRQQSQTDWATFSGQAGSELNPSKKCLDQNSTTLSAVDLVTGECNQNIADQNGKPFFVRSVTLTLTNYIPHPTSSIVDPACNGSVQATVNVAWTDGKCSSGSFCHNVILNSCFTDINGQ
jgi:type II secretory pathway pseudopilin PulG